MTTELLFLPLGVVAGALTQRVTGIGFALVCAPLLVLVAGPFEGVVLSNLLGLTVSVIVFVGPLAGHRVEEGPAPGRPGADRDPVRRLRREERPARAAHGASSACWSSSPSARSSSASEPGSCEAAAAPWPPARASGFMNVTAGVGGPAIVLYAVSTAWEHRKFVATFQFYSIFINLASLAAKGGLPHVSPNRPGRVLRRARRSAWSAARCSPGTSTTSWPAGSPSAWPSAERSSPSSRESSPGDTPAARSALQRRSRDTNRHLPRPMVPIRAVATFGQLVGVRRRYPRTARTCRGEGDARLCRCRGGVARPMPR